MKIIGNFCSANIGKIFNAPIDPWAALDGRQNAPTGTPQYPTLLNAYAARPPWQVAGVDYRVGINTGIVLGDPATISLTGVEINVGLRTVTVDGDNVTLNGWDFSLDTGWSISANGANLLITNCRFRIGDTSDYIFIHAHTTASNITFRYCEMDGNTRDTFNGSLLFFQSVGVTTVEYCWMTNAFGDFIDQHNQGTIIIRYNLVENAGLGSGAHGDYFQVITGPFVATVTFNTSRQYVPGSTQGWMLEPDVAVPGIITSGNISNNTLMASTGGGMAYFMAVTVADLVDTFTSNQNYFDATGAFNLAPGGGRSGPDDGFANTHYTNNVNMVSGLLDENDS